MMSSSMPDVLRIVCFVCVSLIPLTSSLDANEHVDSVSSPNDVTDSNLDSTLSSVAKRSVGPYDSLLDQDLIENDDEKRAKYFLGKRGSGNNKYFLGKRGWGFPDSSEPSMGRRAKYFLGKRSDDNVDELLDLYDDEEKRAKYFLGKRAKYFLGKRDDDKRMKYFLGKRSADSGELNELIKRAKYFLGKREGQPKRAKYFLGKRADSEEDKRAKYFLGKRTAEEDKRAKYFLG